MTAGVFIRLIFPLFSSTKRSTQVLTRKTLPQNGTSSASNQRPLFESLSPASQGSPHRTSPAPSRPAEDQDRVWAWARPTGIVPFNRGNGMPPVMVWTSIVQPAGWAPPSVAEGQRPIVVEQIQKAAG